MRTLALLLTAMALTGAWLHAAEANHGITTQPAGTLMVFNRSGEGIYPHGDSLFTTAQEGKAYVVFADDGKTVYLLQPLSVLPYPYWVQGELSDDGGSITVPLGQYVYWSDHFEAGLVLSWGSTRYSGQEGAYHYSFVRDRGVETVTYAIDGNTIAMLGSDGDITAGEPLSMVGTGLSAHWDDNGDWQGYVEWKTIYSNGETIIAPTPADPVINEWYDCGEQWGGTYLYFTLPAVDTDGNPMSTENLSYSIFVDDDERLTFDAATYQNLSGDMSEFPYGFTDAGMWGDFLSNMIFFYRTNLGTQGEEKLFNWRIGIRQYYTTGTLRTASNIVYTEVFPHGGIDETAIGKEVATVRYFNLRGQEVPRPDGLTVRVTTFTDGTTATAKVTK